MLNGKKYFKGEPIIGVYNIGSSPFAEVRISSSFWSWTGRFHKLPKTDNIMINYGEIIPNVPVTFDVVKPLIQFSTRRIDNLISNFTVAISAGGTINDSFSVANYYKDSSDYIQTFTKTAGKGQICLFVIDSYGLDSEYSNNFYYIEGGVKKLFPKLEIAGTSLYVIKTDTIESFRFNGVDVNVVNEPCKYSIYYLNDYGLISWVSGNKASYKSIDISNDYIELETIKGIDIKKERRLVKQEATNTYNFKSYLMSRDEYNDHIQLYKANKCYLDNGDEVYLTSTSFTEKSSRSDKLVQLDLAVQTKKDNMRYGELIY